MKKVKWISVLARGLLHANVECFCFGEAAYKEWFEVTIQTPLGTPLVVYGPQKTYAGFTKDQVLAFAQKDLDATWELLKKIVEGQ